MGTDLQGVRFDLCPLAWCLQRLLLFLQCLPGTAGSVGSGLVGSGLVASGLVGEDKLTFGVLPVFYRLPVSVQKRPFLPAAQTTRRTRSHPCWTGPTGVSSLKERKDSSRHTQLVRQRFHVCV